MRRASAILFLIALLSSSALAALDIADIDALRASITGDIGVASFKWRIERFMTVFGDPHSRFSTPNPAMPAGRLPVVFVHHGERILAVKADRSGYVNADAPYVTAIGEI